MYLSMATLVKLQHMPTREARRRLCQRKNFSKHTQVEGSDARAKPMDNLGETGANSYIRERAQEWAVTATHASRTRAVIVHETTGEAKKGFWKEQASIPTTTKHTHMKTFTGTVVSHVLEAKHVPPPLYT